MEWHAWLATVAALVGAIANANHRRWGFAVWVCTNTYFASRNLVAGELAQAVLWCAYSNISIWGWVRWGRSQEDEA